MVWRVDNETRGIQFDPSIANYHHTFSELYLFKKTKEDQDNEKCVDKFEKSLLKWFMSILCLPEFNKNSYYFF